MGGAHGGVPGREAVLCGFLGGESGELLLPLLERVTGGAELRMVPTTSASGCYVTDRRSGQRELLAMKLSDPPSRHELDELFSLTCSQAIACGWLVVTNPMPGELAARWRSMATSWRTPARAGAGRS